MKNQISESPETTGPVAPSLSGASGRQSLSGHPEGTDNTPAGAPVSTEKRHLPVTSTQTKCQGDRERCLDRVEPNEAFEDAAERIWRDDMPERRR